MLLFTAYLNVGVFAESAGFADESAVYNVGTPYDKSYVEILFSTGEAETAGVPLAYKEFLISPTGHEVFKIDGRTGKTALSAELSEKVSENSRGVIINGILFQAAKTQIYAVDLEDMSVKNSRRFGEITTDISAIDGFVYFGVKTDGGYSFICADYNNDFNIVWEYKSEYPLHRQDFTGIT